MRARALQCFPDYYILGNYCPGPLSEESEVLVIFSRETGESLCVAPGLSELTFCVPTPPPKKQKTVQQPLPQADEDKARNIKYK